MQNKKGFVLIETLVVTIFTIFIFTLLYNCVVPLLGKYKELSYYDDLDTTYDLYYLKEYIRKDANYELIELENYQEITCDSLTNKEECLNIYDFLDIKPTDEVLFLNTNNIDDVKNDANISNDIKNI